MCEKHESLEKVCEEIGNMTVTFDQVKEVIHAISEMADEREKAGDHPLAVKAFRASASVMLLMLKNEYDKVTSGGHEGCEGGDVVGIAVRIGRG